MRCARAATLPSRAPRSAATPPVIAIRCLASARHSTASPRNASRNAMSLAATLETAETASKKPSLAGLGRVALAEALAAIGVPADQLRMRVSQLWHWIYFRGTHDFSEMTSVSKTLRATLAEHYTLTRPEVVVEQVSSDGTRKWLLRVAAENPGEKPYEIETVYIPEADRGTLCVSSQIGCTLTCTFCHTGTQLLVRNLGAAEIVAQVMVARDALGEWPSPPEGRQLTNIVLMGMGEPLYNYENVAAAMKIVMDPEGLAVSRRKITLSTAGVVPMMARIGAELGVNLAVSLHAVNDE